jgi:hypothetical protein
VTAEHSRRPEAYDIGLYKASQLQLLVRDLTPAILSICMRAEDTNRLEIMAIFCYLVRAVSLEDEDFHKLDGIMDLKELFHAWLVSMGK